MAKFETKVCLVNTYGDIVCELEHINGDYYRLPKEVLWDYMFVGDKFEIKEIETEVKYIKIVKNMSGDSIAKQIQNIIDNDMMDADTRLFFDKHNCVTMEDIRPLLSYFDITNNDEIDNVVFVPNDYFIKRFVENGESFKDKRW